MSHYLIDQIEKTPNIQLRTRTELDRVDGDGRVERVVLDAGRRCQRIEDDGRRVRLHRHEAAKRLAAGRGAARRQGFRPHRPRSDVGRAYARVWKERREPLTLETSAPEYSPPATSARAR